MSSLLVQEGQGTNINFGEGVAAWSDPGIFGIPGPVILLVVPSLNQVHTLMPTTRINDFDPKDAVKTPPH